MKKINHLEKKQIIEQQLQFNECHQELKNLEIRIQEIQDRMKKELYELQKAYVDSKQKLDKTRMLSNEFIENLKTKYEVSTAEELNSLLLT
jgi:ATP-dependent phosphoenolpyruvate carboxykinase